MRELKLNQCVTVHDLLSRTPPGVRELKQERVQLFGGAQVVAPLPGCVN